MAAEKLFELRSLMSRSSVRLLRLRHLLGKTEKQIKDQFANRPLQAFLVDTTDAHQSEYVGDAHKRREFLTGFSGSSGTALVTPSQALLWTDGRYFLQAEQELSDEWTLMKAHEPDVPSIELWTKKNLLDGSFLAIDPYLISVFAARNFVKSLKGTKIELVALYDTENLVDLIWKDRPMVRPSQVTFLSDEYIGRSVLQKLKSLREAIKEKDADAIVLTALDDIAWLFNIRGNDVECNPVVTSYAIVTSDAATVFLDAANQDDVMRQLSLSNVACKPYQSFLNDLVALTHTNEDIKILVDPSQCNVAVFMAIPAVNRKEDTSIVMAQKAIKNAVEIEGMRQAHLRDGAALVRFFSWLQKEMDSGHEDEWDEVLVADMQEKYRRQGKNYVSLSFETISSIGANGSIIHYAPKRGKCAKMSTFDMYLNDSGAQYLDGTTDVTRTLHFGQPSAYEKACFTYVLKGHIALASTVFPEKTEGVRLDAITRAPLWKAGLDYRHGTGHGVGAFLNVHEKGVLLSFHLNPDGLKIRNGMILSNEPGYYENGKFGIRIESVMLVKMARHIESALNRNFCEFETLTMAPIQQKLIEVSLLTLDEVKWLNAYHEEVHNKLQPFLKDDFEAYAYLVQETKPLSLVD